MKPSIIALRCAELYLEVAQAVLLLGHEATGYDGRLSVAGIMVDCQFGEATRHVGFRTIPTGKLELRVSGVLRHNNFRKAFPGRSFRERKDGTFAIDKIAAYLVEWSKAQRRENNLRDAKDRGTLAAQRDMDKLRAEHPELAGLVIYPTASGLVCRTALTYEQASALVEATKLSLPDPKQLDEEAP